MRRVRDRIVRLVTAKKWKKRVCIGTWRALHVT